MANLAPGRPQALLITPIIPAPNGNGLAMRTAMVVEALAHCCDLWAAVVPISDRRASDERLGWLAERTAGAVIVPPDDPRTAATAWLSSPQTREAVARVQELPQRARLASPAAGVAAGKRLGRSRFDLVWVSRLYMVGTAVPFLEHQPRPRRVLDCDDDDAGTLAAIARLHDLHGNTEAAKRLRVEAKAFERLGRACRSWFDQLYAASAGDAAALARRHGLHNMDTLANAVALGPRPSPHSRAREPELIYVGNFNYFPNVDAAERLAVLLADIRNEFAGARLHLAGGRGGKRIEQLEGQAGVRVHGRVEDLSALYAAADLCIVPLRAGGGSRIKILEAFANGVPVVATPAAAAGLDVSAGKELLLAPSDEDLVNLAVRVLRDEKLAADLTRNARRFVMEHHELNAAIGDLSGRVVALLEA